MYIYIQPCLVEFCCFGLNEQQDLWILAMDTPHAHPGCISLIKPTACRPLRKLCWSCGDGLETWRTMTFIICLVTGWKDHLEKLGSWMGDPFLSGPGMSPAISILQGAKLPSKTTSNDGAVELDWEIQGKQQKRSIWDLLTRYTGVSSDSPNSKHCDPWWLLCSSLRSKLFLPVMFLGSVWVNPTCPF